MMMWVVTGVQITGLLVSVAALISARRALARLVEQRDAWVREIHEASVIYDEFVTTWNYGAREEAARIMKDYIAVCEKRDQERVEAGP